MITSKSVKFCALRPPINDALSYAFFNHQRLQPFSAYDAETANSLPVSENPLKVLGYHLNVAEEVRSGAILLFILNGLLLLVNGLDLGYFISGQIPEGMSYSEYVHEGTAALIVSILLAIGIITVYFRNQLSTLINHRIVRVLAYSWLIQNMVSVFFTLYRNQLYINEYSLTYKRIGVYLFLLMALIGLVFTLIKIAGQKSNYYLIRVNSVAFVVVLIISSLIPWDTLILNYNITKAKRTGVMDVEYLLDLSNEALPYLKALNRTYPLADPIQNNKLKQRIARANHNFLQDRHEFDWRSLTVRNERVYNRLLERFKKERR